VFILECGNSLPLFGFLFFGRHVLRRKEDPKAVINYRTPKDLEKEDGTVDRRRYERVNFFCRVSLATSPGAPAREAQSTDISLGGVGLTTTGQYALGQVLTVTFHVRDARRGEVQERVAGRVVNLKADLDGNRLGVEFLEPLDERRYPLLTRKVMSL
jgi:c-di-GMP-binding flagellar brake protein YcgR